MAERDSSLRGVPTEFQSTTPQIAERLILAFRARQDFSQALTLASQMPDDGTKAFAYIHIGQAKAGSGDDPQSSFTRALEIADSGKADHTSSQVYDAVARIQADLGNIEVAQEIIQKATHYNPYAHLGIAIAQAEIGLDPTPTFSAILEREEADAARYNLGNYMLVCSVAEAYHEIGLDPKPLFDRALQYADSQEWGYETVAKSYAKIGDIDSALRVANMIKDHSPRGSTENKNGTLMSIAGQQLKNVDFQGALQTVQTTGSKFLITSLLADSATLQAEQGLDISSVIELTLKNAHEYDESVAGDKYEQLSKSRLANVYARLGVAQAKMGIDPDPMFSLALERALLPTTASNKAQELIKVAYVEANAGVDNSATLLQLLEAADSMTTEEDPQMFADAEQAITWQDIAELAIEKGDYELTRAILGKYEDADYLRVDILAKLAGAEAKRGLSAKELMEMPEHIIAQLLITDTPLVQEALEFFELRTT